MRRALYETWTDETLKMETLLEVHGGKWKKNLIRSWLLLVDVTSYEVKKMIWKKKLEEMMCTDVVAFADIT